MKYDSFGAASNPKLISSAVAQQMVELRKAGKKVILSFGGAGQGFAGAGYKTFSENVKDTATAIAGFVKAAKIEDGGTFRFDGIDIDWEDTDSFLPEAQRPAQSNYDGRVFLISLTQQLRKLLPSPKYTISHAPQPPYLSTSGGHFPENITGYIDVLKSAKDDIDWLNVQYYNQGGYFAVPKNIITQYNEVIKDSANNYGGISASKLVVGKPIVNTGSGVLSLSVVTADVIAPLFATYEESFGGAFVWRYADDNKSHGDWGDGLEEALKPKIFAATGLQYTLSYGFIYITPVSENVSVFYQWNCDRWFGAKENVYPWIYLYDKNPPGDSWVYVFTENLPAIYWNLNTKAFGLLCP